MNLTSFVVACTCFVIVPATFFFCPLCPRLFFTLCATTFAIASVYFCFFALCADDFSVRVCVCVCVCVWTNECVWTSVCVYVCMCVCVYVCMCVWTSVCGQCSFTSFFFVVFRNKIKKTVFFFCLDHAFFFKFGSS